MKRILLFAWYAIGILLSLPALLFVYISGKLNLHKNV